MGNGNIPYFFRMRKFAVGLPLAGNGNIPYGAPNKTLLEPGGVLFFVPWSEFEFRFVNTA